MIRGLPLVSLTIEYRDRSVDSVSLPSFGLQLGSIHEPYGLMVSLESIIC